MIAESINEETANDSQNENVESMEKLLADSLKEFKTGEIIEGAIIAISKSDVMIDIGYKSEGMINITEFNNPEELKVGQTIKVFLESIENQEGNVVLSKNKADKIISWDRTMSAFEEGSQVKGRIIRKVKGGLIVDIGLDAFLPASQVDIRPVQDIDSLMGKMHDFKIVKINHERKNVVVSRRELLEKDREAKRQQLVSKIKKGDVLKGHVKNITDFGAFIDLGGLDGLLHITDMSWGRISHPSEVVALGDEIEVVVLDFDEVKQRVSLGLKQKSSNPWVHAEEKYPISSRVKGRVVNITNYGVFVELEEGIEGLVHISEMSWTKRINHPSEILGIGDTVEIVVLNINVGEQKISLGIKQTEVNPWEKVQEKYPVGTKIEGRIKNITDYGAFVELEEGINGLIHSSDMSWTRKISHPTEVLKKGDDVTAVVLNVSPENKKISLGLKQLTDDPWLTSIPEKYREGDALTGKISKITGFGLFVLLDDEVEGLLHASELGLEEGKKPEDIYKAGDELKIIIAKVDSTEKKIALSRQLPKSM